MFFYAFRNGCPGPCPDLQKTFTSPLFPNSYGKFFEKQKFSINLYKEYTSLKLRELEELPRFGVMSWQPS